MAKETTYSWEDFKEALRENPAGGATAVAVAERIRESWIAPISENDGGGKLSPKGAVYRPTFKFRELPVSIGNPKESIRLHSGKRHKRSTLLGPPTIFIDVTGRYDDRMPRSPDRRKVDVARGAAIAGAIGKADALNNRGSKAVSCGFPINHLADPAIFSQFMGAMRDFADFLAAHPRLPSSK